MTPYLQDPDVILYNGDALETLRQLPDRSVHMCCTSPPFYGLRDYGMEGQIGLEESPDVWVARLVEVFREVRRVLRDDGTLWVEIGDSYAGSGRGPSESLSQPHQQMNETHSPFADATRKPKDLLGQPWLLAFALRADGWYLRSEIIWARPNPMPESVTDRPTKAHSTVFLLSKSPRYFYDQEAIREPQSVYSGEQIGIVRGLKRRSEAMPGRNTEASGNESPDRYQAVDALSPANGANARSVWNIATEPTPFAHFATWPQKLCQRMILAGTSERGVCPECGGPWVRHTKPTEEYAAQTARPGLHELDRKQFRLYLIAARERLGISRAELDRRIDVNGASAWWEGRNYLGKFEQQIPSWEMYQRLKDVLHLDEEYDEQIRRNDVPRYEARKENEEWVNVGATSQLAPRGTGISSNLRPKGTQTLGWRPSCDCFGDGLDGTHVVGPPPAPATILDPFGGSGTTALVARKLGRKCILIELNPDYCALTSDRLRQQSLFAQEIPA